MHEFQTLFGPTIPKVTGLRIVSAEERYSRMCEEQQLLLCQERAVNDRLHKLLLDQVHMNINPPMIVMPDSLIAQRMAFAEQELARIKGTWVWRWLGRFT